VDREKRKRACQAKNTEIEVVNLADAFSPEILRAAFEEEERFSENRFERLKNKVAAVNAINAATNRFATAVGLKVVVTRDPNRIPLPLKCGCFKYSHHDTGSLPDARADMSAGKPITVALVAEEGILIGYAIAVKDADKETEVKIIDVDNYSRREAGLSRKLVIEGEPFQIGVGHVLVKSILTHCPPPLHVDSTTPASRYIFKSLGFIHADSDSNPCILHFPE